MCTLKWLQFPTSVLTTIWRCQALLDESLLSRAPGGMEDVGLVGSSSQECGFSKQGNGAGWPARQTRHAHHALGKHGVGRESHTLGSRTLV